MSKSKIPLPMVDKLAEAGKHAGQLRLAIMIRDWDHVEKCMDRLDALLFAASRQLEEEITP